MRCSSYCTAVSYDIQFLTQNLIQKGFEPRYFDDVIHAQRDIRNDALNTLDIFYFPFGCVVIWGMDESEEKSVLNELKEIERTKSGPVSDIIYFHYEEGSKTFINEESNEIILGDNSIFTKLSISHALAQSVKLIVLEQSINILIEKTTPIPKELAIKGSISLSKKEISKQIGMLFSERYLINIHSDILDTPEFFWRRPSYEPLYLMTAEFQDIQIRQNILNHRMDMIHELYSMLSNELNYIHSTRLEIIVIILIGLEVIMALIHKIY